MQPRERHHFCDPALFFYEGKDKRSSKQCWYSHTHLTILSWSAYHATGTVAETRMQWRTDTQYSLSAGSSYPMLVCRAVFCYPQALWVSHMFLDLLLSFEGAYVEHVSCAVHVLRTERTLGMQQVWLERCSHFSGSWSGSREALEAMETESKVPEQPEQRHERVTMRSTHGKEEHEEHRKTKVLQSLTQAVFLALKLWLSGAASSRQLTAQQPRLCVDCSHPSDFKPQLFSRFVSSILNSRKH